jgi:hypothetical protein
VPISSLADGQGRFSIGGVPDDANASLFLDDKRFVHVRRSFASEDAVVLNARPSAVLAGRVVDGASHGVAGVRVVARTQDPHASGVQEQTTTADDGSYEISGLPTGSYSIFTDARKQGLIAAALEWVSAREGQTREMPEIVLGVGAMVDVYARDEKGAPLIGVSIGYGPNHLRFGSDARTDATGHVHLRVPEGQNSVSVDVAPEGLLIPRTGKTVEVKSQETVNLDFVLKRGLVVAGIVTDENGALVKKLTLLFNPLTRAQIEYLFWNAYAITDDNGAWKAVGLLPGEYSLEVSDLWRIIAPGRVTVAQNSPPVAVKVQAAKLATRRGRVVSATGEPVGGVRVEYSVQVPEGGTQFSMHPLPATSEVSGEFELKGVRQDRKLSFSQAIKKQWQYLRGGEVDERTGELTEIVMVPLDRRVNGIVVDRQGQPIAGAQVFATQTSGVAVSDAEGHFALQNLPADAVTIMAATANGWDTQSLDLQKTNAENVRFVPHESGDEVQQDEVRAFDLLQQVWQESAGTEYYGRRNVALEMMRLDPERAQGIVGQLDELGLAGRIALLARANPDEALRWACRAWAMSPIRRRTPILRRSWDWPQRGAIRRLPQGCIFGRAMALRRWIGGA